MSRGKGKTYTETLKMYKTLAIQFFGLGYIFGTPIVKALILSTLQDFINEIGNYKE